MIDKDKIDKAAHEYFRKGQLGLSAPNSESGFKAGVEFAEKEVSDIAIEFAEYILNNITLEEDPFPHFIDLSGMTTTSKELFDEFLKRYND
jgi:hypothetical protein